MDYSIACVYRDLKEINPSKSDNEILEEIIAHCPHTITVEEANEVFRTANEILKGIASNQLHWVCYVTQVLSKSKVDVCHIFDSDWEKCFRYIDLYNYWGVPAECVTILQSELVYRILAREISEESPIFPIMVQWWEQINSQTIQKVRVNCLQMDQVYHWDYKTLVTPPLDYFNWDLSKSKHSGKSKAYDVLQQKDGEYYRLLVQGDSSKGSRHIENLSFLPIIARLGMIDGVKAAIQNQKPSHIDIEGITSLSDYPVYHTVVLNTCLWGWYYENYPDHRDDIMIMAAKTSQTDALNWLISRHRTPSRENLNIALKCANRNRNTLVFLVETYYKDTPLPSGLIDSETPGDVIEYLRKYFDYPWEIRIKDLDTYYNFAGSDERILNFIRNGYPITAREFVQLVDMGWSQGDIDEDDEMSFRSSARLQNNQISRANSMLKALMDRNSGMLYTFPGDGDRVEIDLFNQSPSVGFIRWMIENRNLEFTEFELTHLLNHRQDDEMEKLVDLIAEMSTPSIVQKAIDNSLWQTARSLASHSDPPCRLGVIRTSE